MFKEVVYSSVIERNGRPYRTIYPVYPGSGNTFRKCAEASDLDPELKDFIAKLQPDPLKIYVVAVALGSGESWSSNVNGDWFSRADLQGSHESFVRNGRVYHLHDNSQNSKSYGEILYSRFNPKMDRVELVFTIIKTEMPDVVKRIEDGEAVDVSMGTKVDFDVCSICNKQSKRFSEYCAHLKYEMNKIYPDGRKVYALNPNPKFFDISIVDVGADRTAKILAKVASQQPNRAIVHSALLAEKVSANKESIMDKGMPDPVERALPEKLKLYWQALGEKTDACCCDVDPRELSKGLGINELLDAFTGSDVMLRPHEFSSLLFDRMNMSDLSDELFGGRQILSSPLSIDDAKTQSHSGSLPLSLPNKYTVERRMSPNSMMMRFRMTAGNKMAGANRPARGYALRKSASQLERTVAGMYCNYIKTASKKIIKKASLELMETLPKIFAAIMIGKSLLEMTQGPSTPSAQDNLVRMSQPTNSFLPLQTADVLGVPLVSMADELHVSPSQLQAEVAKQMQQLDIMRRSQGGNFADQKTFYKVSALTLAPVHVLANCFNLLKQARGSDDLTTAREVAQLSPTATALTLALRKSDLDF